MDNNKLSGRVKVRYKESAERLGISYDDYIQQGEKGYRYCSRCLKWKLRRYFLEYEYTKSHYSGICKVCTDGKSTPAKAARVSWGPSLRAADLLGISVEVYLQKRSEGFRWCSDHKGWFDAKDMLEGRNPQITKCEDCNKARQKEIRARKGRDKNKNQMEIRGEITTGD